MLACAISVCPAVCKLRMMLKMLDVMHELSPCILPLLLAEITFMVVLCYDSERKRTPVSILIERLDISAHYHGFNLFNCKHFPL